MVVPIKAIIGFVGFALLAMSGSANAAVIYNGGLQDQRQCCDDFLRA
jgi:hypothetical protein